MRLNLFITCVSSFGVFEFHHPRRISVVGWLIYCITTCASVFVFQTKEHAPITLPLGPVIPFIGIVFALYLMVNPKGPETPTDEQIFPGGTFEV